MIFIFLRTRSRELRPSGEFAPPCPLLPPPRPPRLALRLPADRQEGDGGSVRRRRNNCN